LPPAARATFRINKYKQGWFPAVIPVQNLEQTESFPLADQSFFFLAGAVKRFVGRRRRRNCDGYEFGPGSLRMWRSKCLLWETR
jgi:hypothetical protein